MINGNRIGIGMRIGTMGRSCREKGGTGERAGWIYIKFMRGLG